jgi:hypothetical protein
MLSAQTYEVDGSWVALTIRLGGAPLMSKKWRGSVFGRGQPRQVEIIRPVWVAPPRCGEMMPAIVILPVSSA